MSATTAERAPEKSSLFPIIGSLSLFGVWMAGTWLMEGRLNTLLRPEAAGLRLAYALLVNLGLGIGLGGWWLLRLTREGSIDRGRSGLAIRLRTPLAAIAGLGLGAAAYTLQGAPTWDPVVLTNGFAQVFVVSAAEVLVCWAVVANVVREVTAPKRRWLGYLAGAVVASVLFGVYHFAHSPPFNTLSMVGLLTVVGLATSVFYFVSQDIWGTLLFHNSLAVFGVVSAMAEEGVLQTSEGLQFPLIVTAVAALLGVLTVQVAVRRPRAEE